MNTLTQQKQRAYTLTVLAKSSADSLAAWKIKRGHNTPLHKCVFFCVYNTSTFVFVSARYDGERKEIFGSAGFFWFQSANLSFRRHQLVLAVYGDDLVQNQKRSNND